MKLSTNILVTFFLGFLTIIFIIYETSFHSNAMNEINNECPQVIIKEKEERIIEKIIEKSVPVKLKIAVVSAMHDLSFGEIAQDNFKKYCDLHGYSLHVHTKRTAEGRSLPWEKLTAIKEAMIEGNYDYIFWMDADSLFMNMSKRLEDFIVNNNFPDLLFSGDLNFCLNSGHMIIKNNWWSFTFFEDVWNSYPVPQPNHDDQTAMLLILLGKTPQEIRTMNRVDRSIGGHCLTPQEIEVCKGRFHPRFNGHLAMVPQRDINSYSPYPWFSRVEELYQEGDFIIHFAGLPEKLTRMRDYAKKTTV
ncbi:alpha-16-mannosyltransferase mnn11-related [Anaeramoeba ignava]|uniref:Alpha-16-mannosyltransferase mnn11-related n=1 Tax=Anaeramoeba ignava TaxID=1746090 RepID=A0A9Q0LE22_ANAIG|nr:alpha-16-mannosyltransferase mnn11-related [Anaeramoeba ignava]